MTAPAGTAHRATAGADAARLGIWDSDRPSKKARFVTHSNSKSLTPTLVRVFGMMGVLYGQVPACLVDCRSCRY
jgi:hypothetical protein